MNPPFGVTNQRFVGYVLARLNRLSSIKKHAYTSADYSEAVCNGKSPFEHYRGELDSHFKPRCLFHLAPL